MTELKLRQLHRGYILTDFDGNEVGVKDPKQAMEEIKKLLNIDEKSEQQTTEEYTSKTKQNTVELHRKIFEAAKEHISLNGKINGAKIARELEINISTVHSHLKKMNIELEKMITKWKDERDKKVLNVETITDAESTKVDQ